MRAASALAWVFTAALAEDAALAASADVSGSVVHDAVFHAVFDLPQ